jgi:hypothetical protein
MAEIRVDPARRSGRGLGWLWALLALVVVAGVIGYLVWSGTINIGGINGTRP